MKQEAEAHDEWVGDIRNPYFYQFIHFFLLITHSYTKIIAVA